MNPFKVLIAYDGSSCANEALRSLKTAGLPSICQAFVLTVADTWLNAKPMAAPTEVTWLTEALAKGEQERKRLVGEAQELAQSAADALTVWFPTWEIRATSKADVPAWGIVTFADEWQPDLLVMGSHGRSALGRAFLGSVSQKVLTHARSSVRIVHPGSPTNGSARVLIGFDGSAHARRAVTRVAQRPWPKNTQVRLVSAFDDRLIQLAETGITLQRQGHTDKGRKLFWKKQLLEPALRDLKGAGLRAEGVIRKGHPVDVLLREAQRWHATSLFVGARGLVALERFLLGSVSTRVANKAPCAVEVVR